MPVAQDSERQAKLFPKFRAGHFRYFLILSIIKNDFCIFYKVNLTGNGFSNRTGAEIGY